MAVLGWHFIAERGKMASYNWSEPRQAKEAFETETHHGAILLCRSGLHASERLIDAIMHAPGVILRRVRCAGSISRDDDKFVCTERQVLGTADIGRLLLDFTDEFGPDNEHTRAAYHYKNAYCDEFLLYVRRSSDLCASHSATRSQPLDAKSILFRQAKMEQEKWLLEQIRIRYPELAVELPPV
jgi:hypothetical protein